VSTPNANPLVQQRQFLAGEAVAVMPLGVVSVAGVDRLSWLHSLLSQNLVNLGEGASTSALLLDPQGHVEHLIHVVDDGTTSWLITATDGVAGLMDWLKRMVFRKQLVIQDCSEELTVVGSWGKPVSELLGFGVGAEPVAVWQASADVAQGGYRYGTAPDEPWLLFENLLTADQLAQVTQKLALVGQAAPDALRVAAHQVSAAELDDKTLPHELDLLATAVHLSKGCYRGQETVAKVHNLGHPPRRLVLLHLDGSEHELPLPGSPVFVAAMPGQPCGRVTSVAQHHAMGPVALAVISRRTPVDAALVIQTDFGPVSATQEVIVPADAGKVADVPRLPRLHLGGKK